MKRHSPRFLQPIRLLPLALMVLALATRYAPADSPQRLATGEYLQVFSFKPQSPATSVAVAGDFNGWSTSAHPMAVDGDGVYRAAIAMREGIHHYKFFIDGKQWINDPAADASLNESDNHGGSNSGVFVGPDGRKLPPPQPDAINAEGIKHDPSDSRDRDVVSKNLLLLALRTQADDVQNVIVHVQQADSASWKSFPLAKLSSQYGFDRFGTLIPTDAAKVEYYFELTDGSAKRAQPSEAPSASNYSVEMQPAIETPDWAKDAIWYQIFPERFRNGDTSNDPGDKDYEHLVRWQADWWKTQSDEHPGDENFYKGLGNVWRCRYGGDIQGIIWALSYLRRLGVNAIYLNPIFESDSMHKYDTSDYRHVDEHFGFKGDLAELKGETDDPKTWQWTKSDKLFLDFVAQAHQQGFKVIIDGVFNHVGRSHWAFQDVLKNGKASKYADWFDVRDWNEPIKYIAWDRGDTPSDDGAMPVFKKDAAHGLVDGPREHIMAIMRRWLAPDGDPAHGVDGFRLDVPEGIPHPFWVEWRKLVKSTKPDAYITGEIWSWAQPWLKGDEFDAVMNYRFAEACQQFFVNQKQAISPTQFGQQLLQIVYSYPFQISLEQQNLFDSHDTDRFASMFVNPDLAYDAANRIQDNGPAYSPARPTEKHWTRMEQAVQFQMAFVGAPMIYYGDEAGMWSPDDPSNRQPMIWADLAPNDDPQVQFNKHLFQTYQRSIALRHKLPALRLGFFHTLTCDDAGGTYAYERALGHERVYVVINRSAQQRDVHLPISEESPVTLLNWLDPAQADLVEPSGAGQTEIQPKIGATGVSLQAGHVNIRLEPYSTAVLSGMQ